VVSRHWHYHQPETGEEVKQNRNRRSLPANITYILQNSQMASPAVQVAQPFPDDSFIMYLGDNLIQQDNLSHFLKRFSETTRCLILLRPVANPAPLALQESMNTGAY